jgi:hypothetical protein
MKCLVCGGKIVRGYYGLECINCSRPYLPNGRLEPTYKAGDLIPMPNNVPIDTSKFKPKILTAVR